MCLKTIDKNTTDALAADGFTDIDLDTLCSVLSRDTLRIKEAKLFQAVIRLVWRRILFTNRKWRMCKFTYFLDGQLQNVRDKDCL